LTDQRMFFILFNLFIKNQLARSEQYPHKFQELNF